VTAPLLQSFPAGELVREEGQGETDDGREPIIFSDDKRNVMVSKSVSVSRVSVEIGGVRVEKKIDKTDDKLSINDGISENFQSNKNLMKPQSFFQKLIAQLKAVASISSGKSYANSNLAIEPDLHFNTPAEDLHADEYQLLYRYDEYAGDDLDTTDEEEEYRNYLYDVYNDDISDAYIYSRNVSIISDTKQGNHYDELSAPIPYNLSIESEESEQYKPVIDNQSNNNLSSLVTVSQKSDLVRSRSDQARGRSLIPEDDIKYFSEESGELSEVALKTQPKVKAQNTNDILSDDEYRNIHKVFAFEFSSSKKALDGNIRIGIFVGVILGVIITAGSVLTVLVTRRKARSAKLVTDEDQSTTDSQFAFSRGLKHEESVHQEHFNTNFGKPSYFCDDLHSLDNDSFLTSLETISVKDKLSWT